MLIQPGQNLVRDAKVNENGSHLGADSSFELWSESGLHGRSGEQSLIQQLETIIEQIRKGTKGKTEYYG